MDYDVEINAVRVRLGRWLEARRGELGLTRREVVERMGYSNMSRGIQLLRGWERGDELPQGDRKSVLATALEDTDARIAGFSKEAEHLERRQEAEERRLEAVNQRALDAEVDLLRQHADVLEAGLEQLAARPEWWHARLRSTQMAFAYLGEVPLTLGPLVECWMDGSFSWPCDDCGGTFRVVRIGGSPLSGSHAIGGFCGCGGLERKVRRMPALVAAREFFGSDPKRPLRRVPTTDIIQGLAEVVHGLGAPGPGISDDGLTVVINDPSGEPLASWHPATGLTSERLAVGSVSVSREEIRSPSRVGGRPVIGSISPLEFGVREGDRLVVEVDGGRFVATDGTLRDPRGELVATFDGVLPDDVIGEVVVGLVAGRRS